VFFGFRLVRRDPTLLLILAAMLAVATLVVTNVTWREEAAISVAMQAFVEAADGASEQAEAWSSLAAASAAYWGSPDVLGGKLLLLIVWALAQGAIVRGLVHDRREGVIAGLTLGGDELRIVLVTLVSMLAVFGAGCAGLLVVAIVSGVLGLVLPTAAGALAMLGAVGAGVGMLLVATRLAAAPAASVGERRAIVLGSWRLTRGRMWGLLGANVILVFMMLAAFLVLRIVSAVLAPDAAALLAGMTAVSALEDPGGAFAAPGFIALVFLGALFDTLAMAGFAGVGAYAYRWLGAAAGFTNAPPPQDGAVRPPARSGFT
jgi:hypothetical protein